MHCNRHGNPITGQPQKQPLRCHNDMARKSVLAFSFLSLAVLCSVSGHAQTRLHGEYRTRLGRVLILSDSGTYRYRSFECYHMVQSKGTWSVQSDTLYLHFNQTWANSDSSLIGNTESFDRRPLLIRGRRLYFVDWGVRSTTYFKKHKSQQ